MDKEKFDNAAFKICRLLKNKSSEYNMRFSPDIPQEIVTNANNYIDNYLDREIVKAAREIIAAAGDDIAEKPTPAGQYVSDIKFNLDGSAIVYYNGDTAGKRYLISARYEIEDKD